MTDRSVDIISSGAEDQDPVPLLQSISLNGIASAEAFGTVVVAGPVTVTSIPSAEAFGSPTLNLKIYPASIPSAEAFGTPKITLYIKPTAIPSAEAFGTPKLNLKIYLNGIPSAEAFGSPVVSSNELVFPNGIPSAEAFGSPQLNLRIYPNGVPSAEAFGTPTIGQGVKLTGIPSAEAFGSPQVNLHISVTGIPSAEAFGAPTLTVGQVVHVFGIPSQEAFGFPVVAGPITLVGSPSAETFGLVTIKNFGLLQVLSGARGDIAGGTPLQLTGAVLDMTACSDDFSDGIINPMWTPLDAGGGITTELAAAHALELETRTTAGAVAGLRSVELSTGIDVSVTFVPKTLSLPKGGLLRFASLALHVSAGNEFRLDFETDRAGATKLHIRETVSGQLWVDQVISVGNALGSTTLRLVRAGGRVLAFINGTLIADAVWLSTAASLEYLVSNDPTNTSRVRTLVTAYLRHAAVNLGTEPVLAYTAITPGQVIAISPKNDRPKTVDVVVYGCDFVDTVVNGFTYVVEDRLVVGRSAQSRLVVLNDPSLKEK